MIDNKGHAEMTALPTPEEVIKSGILITSDLIKSLRAEILSIFDFDALEAAQKRRGSNSGKQEYAWVNQPEIPLLLQANRNIEKWIKEFDRQDNPSDTATLGPFVRLGLALHFARRLKGGPERLAELRALALTNDFPQLQNKAFELEAAFFLARTSGREDFAFGPLGGKPDIWLVPEHPLAIPVECKVVSGGKRPSQQCRDVWKRFIIWAVKRMKRHKVSAGICLRTHDDFGPEVEPVLHSLTDSLLDELAGAQDETWGLRSADDGAFVLSAYRLCQWGAPRPPFHVPLGLDGDIAVWVQQEVGASHVRKPYFFALKFQSPELKADAVIESFKTAADQLKATRPNGPGLAVLKVGPLRRGDLFEIDGELRRALATRSHVNAAVLLWDESAVIPDKEAGEHDKFYAFSLKSYLVVNASALVPTDWPDSRPIYFPELPGAVLREASGELGPFDFEEEEKARRSGTVIVDSQQGNVPVLLQVKKGDPAPALPHVVKEDSELNESNGMLTFLFRLRATIAQTLLASEDPFLFEWFVIGTTHFRIYKDRHFNFRINRRTALYQDNVAIDLVPFGHVDTLHLQLVWTPDDLTASLRWSDQYHAARCKAARSSVD